MHCTLGGVLGHHHHSSNAARTRSVITAGSSPGWKMTSRWNPWARDHYLNRRYKVNANCLTCGLKVGSSST